MSRSGVSRPFYAAEQHVSKHITIEQILYALQCQDDGSRVVITYNADDQHRVQVQSMDLLYVIIRDLAEAIEYSDR
jgi:hypothetical protein